MMTSTQTTSTRGSAARQMAVLLVAGLFAAGNAEAARNVASVTNLTCPSSAGTLLTPRVTVSELAGSTSPWRSTQFTWSNGLETFVGCSNDPRPDVTSQGTATRTPYNPAPIAPSGAGYSSVEVEAFSGDDCTGDGATGGSTPLTVSIPACSPATVQNPDLAAACGQKIILILDESYSIATVPANNTEQVKNGAKALLTALADTGSAVSVIEFGTNARLAQIGAFTPGQYVDVTSTPSGGTLTDFFAYLDDQTGSSTDPDGYCPGCTPAQYTNWQDALLDAGSVIQSNGPADMVVVLTDGNPTNDNIANNGCDQTNPSPPQCIPPAVAAADALKQTGAHTLVVAVGGNINLGNIQLISGPDEITAATTAQVKVGDFTQLPFDQLETAFRQLAFVLCAPSVTVNKLVDPDGSGPADPVRTALFPFESKVFNADNADPAAYQWVSPRAASDCATPTPEAGLGCPGPGTAGAPDNVGQVQLGWTGSNGSLNFGWVPGTVANPLADNSTMVLREDATGFEFRDLVCRRERLDLANPDNPPTQTLFACTETGTGTACTGDPSECGTLVFCRNGLDVPNVDDGVVISVGPGDIVTCEVLNYNNLDFGDAPSGGEVVVGVARNYLTTLAEDGPRHEITPDLKMGTAVTDAEADGMPANTAINDDIMGTTPDDEDGVTFQTFAGAGFPIQANVTGYVGDVQAMLCGYLDGAADGVLDGTFTQNISNYGNLGFGIGTATAGAGNEGICILVPGAGGFGLFTSLNIPAVPGFNGASATCQTDSINKTFQCALTFNPNFTSVLSTYARFRLTRDPAFFTDNSPSPTGPADSGEVEDYRILVNPTAVTIGSVELTVATVADFLGGLGVDGMDIQALLDLLAAWDPEAAAALAGADREAILAALRRYLDPDGDGQVAVLRWDTLEQRGTVGFYVDRREEGRDSWVRINGDMLPAIIGAPLGGEYLLADPTARAGVPYEYTLIEQEAQGTTRSYGPFRLEVLP